MRHATWIFATLLLATASAISYADSPDTQQGACYLGFGKILEAAPFPILNCGKRTFIALVAP